MARSLLREKRSGLPILIPPPPLFLLKTEHESPSGWRRPLQGTLKQTRPVRFVPFPLPQLSSCPPVCLRPKEPPGLLTRRGWMRRGHCWLESSCTPRFPMAEERQPRGSLLGP